MVASNPLKELRKRVIELRTGCFNFAWSRAPESDKHKDREPMLCFQRSK